MMIVQIYLTLDIAGIRHSTTVVNKFSFLSVERFLKNYNLMKIPMLGLKR